MQKDTIKDNNNNRGEGRGGEGIKYLVKLLKLGVGEAIPIGGDKGIKVILARNLVQKFPSCTML